MKKKISQLRNFLTLISNAELSFYVNDEENYWVHIYPETVEIQETWVGLDGFQHQHSQHYDRNEKVYKKLIKLLMKAGNCTINTFKQSAFGTEYLKRYEI